MVRDKISTNHTYLEATNYWTPLNDNNDDDNNEEKEEINITKESGKAKPKGNKWTRRITRRQEQRMIIDSGATSHFISEDMNLPKGEKSNKQIYLPDDSTLGSSTKTKLPFDRLSEAAREADIVPGLKRSIMSVNKNVGGRIHNNIPSRRRRRNDPPRGLSPNHHDGTTNTPRKQTQRREIVDNIRKDGKE